MQVTISDAIRYIGVDDKDIDLFESQYVVPEGVSYNSYVILDEKIAVMDTVDARGMEGWEDKLLQTLNGKKPEYLIISHLEPDHAGSIGRMVELFPEVKLVASAKAIAMLPQFFEDKLDAQEKIAVKEGEELSLGTHTLVFYMAPMVHWPEVMVTFDTTDGILYSADAFGTFGALAGNVFADEVDFENKWLDEARRYYTNIVGKYGPQVQMALKKALALDIKMICPLHGPIWRENIAWFVDKYNKWSTYTPEDNTVLIAYASIYGGTENAANILASELAKKGIKNIAMTDVSVTHPSYIISEAFRCSHIVFAAPTYNAGIFTPMETLLLDLAAHNLQNRTVAFIENGSWAPISAKLMGDIVAKMKNMTVLASKATLKSTVKDAQREELKTLASEIAETL